jgi:tRNA uridine 5-carboxymethylaminomethyl modification enzyme
LQAWLKRNIGVQKQLEIQVRYSGYLARQSDEIEKLRRHEGMKIHSETDYSSVTGLSSEVCEKLQKIQPATIGQAARVPGVTPAAVSVLMVHLKKTRKQAA